jgi:hypothetical protein
LPIRHPRQYQEWILPPGRTVIALGDVHRDAEDGLVMQASERRPLVLTTAAESELDTTIRRDVRNARALASIFLSFTVVLLAALIIVAVAG